MLFMIQRIWLALLLCFHTLMCVDWWSFVECRQWQVDTSTWHQRSVRLRVVTSTRRFSPRQVAALQHQQTAPSLCVHCTPPAHFASSSTAHVCFTTMSDGLCTVNISFTRPGQIPLRYPARQLARELDSVMEFDLNWTKHACIAHLTAL